MQHDRGSIVTEDLRELFEGFSIHLQTAGRRPSTVDWYAKHARRFFSWLKQESIPATVSKISVLRIRKFVAYQQSSIQACDSNPYVPTHELSLSSSYIVDGVCTLRAWFNWMQDEGVLSDNPMDKVRTPKQQQRIIGPLETEEIRRLLKAVEGNLVSVVRNRATILMLLDCGLRVSELCALETNDVNIKDGWVRE